MMLVMSPGYWFVMICAAVILDWLFGDPVGFPHPIILIGKFIGLLEELLNRGRYRKLRGLLMWLIVIFAIVIFIAFFQLITQWLHFALYAAFNIWLLSTTLAAKSLADEAKKVFRILKTDDLEAARTAVGYLVGRDTTKLSQEELIRATIETTAENTIDGVLAPLFYMFIGCFLFELHPFLNPLVLAMVYKGVNTMDSMVGYIYRKYRYFGYFPAKIDDVVNFPVARIGSWLMLLGGFALGYNLSNGLRIYRRDKKAHKSPNAGHPEAVVAGLLGIQLGGSNTYFGVKSEKPTIGDADHPLVGEQIGEACTIMYSSEIAMVLVMTVIVLAFYLIGG